MTRMHDPRYMSPPAPFSMLAGYRVVRRLGSGARAEIFLGVPERRGEAAVAIKVYRPVATEVSIATEFEALSRITSPHSVALRDVASGPDGRPVAVLARTPGGSLARLLADRGTIGVGEAVTLLAPLAALIAELHSIGVAHGALGAGSVHFGARGEPVLLGFGHAIVFGSALSMAALDSHAAAAAERERLVALASLVIDRVALDSPVRTAGGRDPALSRLRAWLAGATPDAGFARELESRLFDTAAPVPIEFGRGRAAEEPSGRRLFDSRGHTGGASLGLAAVDRAGVEPGHTDPELAGHPAAATVTARLVARFLGARPLQYPTTAKTPRVAQELIRAATRALANLLPFAHPAARASPSTTNNTPSTTGAARPRVRNTLWGVTAVAATLAITAMLLLPAGGAPDGGKSSDTPSVSSAPGTAAQPVAEAVDPAASDDPLIALPSLLGERERCIRELSVLCLDGVDQQGSGLLTDDRRIITAILDGSTPAPLVSVDTAGISLSERLGGTALVALAPDSNPASVLMIRSEAGWRLRELIGR